MSTYLAHHGIKGQKWGNRRYQYKDGSLTPEGRRRYGVLGSTRPKAGESKNSGRGRSGERNKKSRLKTAAKVALGVGAAAAVGYGAYKIGKASGRYNRANVYRNAADIASEIARSSGKNFQEYAHFANKAREAGNQRAANAHTKAADYYRLREFMYKDRSKSYSKKVSQLKNHGGKADRLAYSFVEKIAKNRQVNWDEVKELLDIDY